MVRRMAVKGGVDESGEAKDLMGLLTKSAVMVSPHPPLL
jgi:hypothetical protein